MNSSYTLTELTAVKYQRMDICSAIRRRTVWRPPYALTTALELLSVEMPRIASNHQRMMNSTVVAVPHPNAKRHVQGITAVVWPFSIDTVTVDNQFICTSPTCTWAMLSPYLELEELIVLADSMMRRDRRLRRTTIDALSLYLDNAYRQVQEAQDDGKARRLFRGYNNCRRALLLARSGTDSSMETRTRFVPPRYGLDMPQVNYPIYIGRSTKPLYLDLAYPEFKICIEYEGSHHARQWLGDVKRRQDIEDDGWKYLQATKLDIGYEDREEALARRIADKMQEVTGKTIQLTPRKTIRQLCDARTTKRAPLYERLRFAPLLPISHA
ncbi:hypothetical protein [Bifidobacterium olomucense]|uniref:DUF559 domain-containing protein n=1 Tax=Bifidobacterium olomucense TaxID=2675324 RepID=A0A7Y0EYU1_9BIFI|nr:hypothetical protein [Bifidobacterium sp. DSM 109959]NMM98894.1 hypothetical protein [Bifidobacterium sp. DSM 109959]